VSVLSTSSATVTVSSTVASVTASSESLARSPTPSYGPKVATSLSSLSPGGTGFTAKSSAVTTTTAASSAAATTFSNTFQNFVGQNYASQLDGGASDLPTLSSPEIPRGKKRQTKLVFSVSLGSGFVGDV